ncbi:MAG TPA: Gfo/Idh/MocA family oxidoreductase, partial [Vicinamibacterales bacterium]|nr:Gfo/Idh/MocA family oxidoreductase [Vicinamibacterales bacterium]
MNLSPEQLAKGRRNFLKAIAGVPAVAALGAAATITGPVKGGRVKVGFIGVGGQGRALLTRTDHHVVEVKALADIRPDSLAAADEILKKAGQPPAKHYVEFADMLEHEDIEAVITAPPLWMHADIVTACLDAGKHVLCEKMMAKTREGYHAMADAARRNNRILEIGYQRNYSPVYRTAYEGVMKTGALGEVYHVRTAWMRNGNWRRNQTPPSKDFDASKWGYPTWDHLANWRLYWRYSEGLFAELGSHQVNAVNWFLGAAPERVQAMGGVYRFKDGRELPDHVFATFEYPGGITGTFSSVESNAFDERYEAFFGTKGTLIIRNENEALLFDEGTAAARPTGVDVAAKGPGALLETSETKPHAARGNARRQPAAPRADAISPSTYEIVG